MGALGLEPRMGGSCHPTALVPGPVRTPQLSKCPVRAWGGVVTHPTLETPEDVSPEAVMNMQPRFWDLQAASPAVPATPAPQDILASLGLAWRSLRKWPGGGKGAEPHGLQVVLSLGSHRHSNAISSLCPAHPPSSARHGT